jgi:hypothetical protein
MGSDSIWAISNDANVKDFAFCRRNLYPCCQICLMQAKRLRRTTVPLGIWVCKAANMS